MTRREKNGKGEKETGEKKIARKGKKVNRGKGKGEEGKRV